MVASSTGASRVYRSERDGVCVTPVVHMVIRCQEQIVLWLHRGRRVSREHHVQCHVLSAVVLWAASCHEQHIVEDH